MFAFDDNMHTFATSVGAQRRRVNGSAAAALRCSCASRYKNNVSSSNLEKLFTYS
jgi:hypothetical protein